MTSALLLAASVALTAAQPSEGVVESHLLAPCCWQQTLDVHDSEISRVLRAEVRERLAAGESPDAIEDSLVQRFGERMRAVPRKDPTPWFALGGVFVVCAAGVTALVVVRRKARPNAHRPLAPSTGVDPYDAALDEALRDLP
ncbi:MAG: cytochrome c-type biogenesis protein CcmH [Myxococcales bacterium]|nr:cytochrome c-type biogenesis protein CcmH [Myxococcales bacterium]